MNEAKVLLSFNNGHIDMSYLRVAENRVILANIATINNVRRNVLRKVQKNRKTC